MASSERKVLEVPGLSKDQTQMRVEESVGRQFYNAQTDKLVVNMLSNLNQVKNIYCYNADLFKKY